jgi:hypothetical protein
MTSSSVSVTCTIPSPSSAGRSSARYEIISSSGPVYSGHSFTVASRIFTEMRARGEVVGLFRNGEWIYVGRKGNN